MKGLRTTFGVSVLARRTTRTTGYPTPGCEALEGRQLLNGSWSAHSRGDAPTSGGTDAKPAEMRPFDHTGTDRTNRGTNAGMPALPGDAGTSPRAAPSAQAQADMQTLQTDIKAFQAEIPASLTATIKADDATIQKALESLTPAERKALMASSPPSATSTTAATAPAAQLQSLLTAANVPNASQIESDFQNYETTVSALDPTLQAKIATDQANLAQALGVSLPAAPSGTAGLGALGLGLGFPGGPMGLGIPHG